MGLPGSVVGLSASTLLTGTFVALTFISSGRPVGKVAIHIVDCSFVARLCSIDGVDGCRRCGIVRFFVIGNPCRKVTDVLLEFVDGVLGSGLVDAPPLEVCIVALVGRRIAIVARDDSEVAEPA